MIIIFEIKIKPFVVIKLTKINKKPSCLLLEKVAFSKNGYIISELPNLWHKGVFIDYLWERKIKS